MAYIALYRKYRPTNFEDVAGQKHIVKTLQNAVQQNRIAHAYLFCGPRGTGKTSTAKIFAKMINCESKTKRPCGKCDNCLAIQQGNHPDIIEIDAASNNGVDQVRDLIEKVKYAPLKGKYKVYIIDEVHMMSSGAFNALLKTIEEPPAHVIFIFATTEPHKVLPTIISRCQRYDFTKISVKDMMESIKKILEKENIQYEEEAVRLVCQLADGGMRDALSIVDQVIAYSLDKLTCEAINAIYGIVTVPEKIELLQMVSNQDAKGCMQKINEFAERGIDIKRCTNDMIEILKESVIHDYTKDASLCTILNKDEIHDAKLGRSTKERLSMIEELIKTYDQYRFASNIQSYFEVCLLNMMSIEDKEVNVSRETSSTDDISDIPETAEESVIDSPPETKQSVKKEIKGLDHEYMLSLLVGANKTYKHEDLSKLEKLSNYYLSPAWARYANLLRDMNLVASGKEYIIVGVKNEAIANEINELDAQGAFIDFMEVLLSKKKKVFAITNEEQKQLINEFIQRQKSHTLPEAASVKLEEDSLELVKNLFGEENIEIKE
ncbi:DNA polymerase III subunit gamma/tau [uncultured Traorella sp.]|uniref:DNA polymerase III subunit gamma/tau n=1 Tax=uncultured Traorella sp. TaxID=1929048 RepID=UPI0025D679E2|nr:DNA polymerase III subunit gamma/tau [uncultured Traorella sp.]